MQHTVLLAVATRVYFPLAEDLAARGILQVVIGDARSPAMVIDAVHQGYLAAASLSETLSP